MGLVEKDGVLVTEEEFEASKKYDAGERVAEAKEKIQERKGLNPRALQEGTAENRARKAILSNAEKKRAETAAIEAKMAREYPDNR